MRRRLRHEFSEPLLTLLAILFAFTVFLFAPLQALGIFAFQAFAILALLAIIGSMLVISDHPAALIVMSIAFVANVSVFFIRLLLLGPITFTCWRSLGLPFLSRSELWWLKRCSSQAR